MSAVLVACIDTQKVFGPIHGGFYGIECRPTSTEGWMRRNPLFENIALGTGSSNLGRDFASERWLYPCVIDMSNETE